MFRQMVSGEAWMRISLETVRVSRGGLRRPSMGPRKKGRSAQQASVVRLAARRLRAITPAMMPPTDEARSVMGIAKIRQMAPSRRKRTAMKQVSRVGSHGANIHARIGVRRLDSASLIVISPITIGPMKRNAIVMTQVVVRESKLSRW